MSLGHTPGEPPTNVHFSGFRLMALPSFLLVFGWFGLRVPPLVLPASRLYRGTFSEGQDEPRTGLLLPGKAAAPSILMPGEVPGQLLEGFFTFRDTLDLLIKEVLGLVEELLVFFYYF